MTKQQFTDAFLKFMSPTRAGQLAEALCPGQQVLQVIDDELDIGSYEDGSIFDENGEYQKGVAASEAQRNVNRMFNHEYWLLSLNADMLGSAWMRRVTDELLGKWKDNGLYSMDIETEKGKSCGEIAVAICAIRKAFPDDASDLIRTHIKENPVYSVFWDQVQDTVSCLLPDNMRNNIQ